MLPPEGLRGEGVSGGLWREPLLRTSPAPLTGHPLDWSFLPLVRSLPSECGAWGWGVRFPMTPWKLLRFPTNNNQVFYVLSDEFDFPPPRTSASYG